MHLAVHNIKQREGESTRAFVTRNLVEFLSTDLPTTYKGLMEKTYTWIKAREVENNGALNDRREGFEKSRKNPSWDNKKGHKNRDRDNRALKRKSVEESVDGVREITFLPFLSINSSDLVIIKAQISRRLMSRVYMDSGSSCEVIYEHCFLKLKLSIGTAMQRMGIIVYTIYEAIKFHTPRGIGTIFLTRKFDKARKEQKKLKGTPQKATKDILNCVDTKERIVVNEEYSKQTIVIGRQLPTSFKMKLHDMDVKPYYGKKKDDGRWKLCVDFTDINKACPKDHHPLPAIDQKVEILSMFQLKCFLDAYKGYHQIQMEEITRKRQPSTQEKECSAIKDYLLKMNKRSVVSRKRKKAGTRVLCEPIAVKSIIRLPRVGKTHTGPHTCRKKASKGTIAKWAFELGEHEIEFKGRNSVTGQILADFLGLMLVRLEGKEYTYALRFEFETTKNEAEYEALLAGLLIATKMKIQELAIFVDSQLVANQHVRRDLYKKVDALSKLASMTFSKLAKEVLVEVVHEKSIIQREVADIVKEEGDNWMLPIREYLQLGILPSDPQKARKLQIKAPWATANNIRRCEVPRHSHRLLQKMGRSKATDIHNWEAYGEIRIFPVFSKGLEYSKPSPLSIIPKQMGRLRSPTGTSTTLKSSNGETSFSLVYGSEAIVPIKIGVETKRIQDFDVKQNEKRRRENLDMLEDRRESYD
ncbi:reverse transcriptase domain-containing protein [Tanacetum coccineum]